MSESQAQQLQEQQYSEELQRPTAPAPQVKTTSSAEDQPSQASPTSPQTPTFDPSQYQATLKGTPASTFARTASAYASSPSVGGLRNPDLIDCILVDHAQVLTLFSHFFQAAEAGAVHIMDLLTGAIVLELRLHSQAEMQVLYPIMAQRLGGEGASLTQRALAEHSMLEKSLEEVLRLRGASEKEPLITRVKQLEIETMTHLGEEESLLLPRMAAVCTSQELTNLGLAFRTAKQTAPLMPQPDLTMAALGVMSPTSQPRQTGSNQS